MKEPAIMTNRKKCISFIRRLHVTKPMFCRFLCWNLILFTPVSLERNKEILWQRKSFRKNSFLPLWSVKFELHNAFDKVYRLSKLPQNMMDKQDRSFAKLRRAQNISLAGAHFVEGKRRTFKMYSSLTSAFAVPNWGLDTGREPRNQ